jgi:Gpi18-like mannosyltransferase
MIRKHGLALFAFGIALSFKLQAIFLAPVLLALFARRIIHWKYFVLVPLALLLALVPAWIAGRPIVDLLNIYLFQTSQFESLTMNAPSVYAWLPASKQVFNLFYLPGVIAGVVAAFILLVVIYKSPNEITPSQIAELALLSVLVIPFFLPKMHERYFYPADVISIALAFYVPRLFYMPLLVGGASFLAYQPYLFGAELVPMPVLTLVLLVAISILFYHVMTLLYSAPTSKPLSPTDDPAGAR